MNNAVKKYIAADFNRYKFDLNKGDLIVELSRWTKKVAIYVNRKTKITITRD
jgi:hypothetical protein